MKSSRTGPARLAGRLVVLTLLASLLAALPACERQQSGPGVAGEAGVSSPADPTNPHEIARRLIKQTISSEDDRHVAVEIDHELLSDLAARAKQDAGAKAFRDPLLAAWLFAPYIGVPTDAVISVEQVSPEAEAASGLYIAVASVSGGSFKMRLVSEPGPDGQPTLWVLNDYDK